MIMAGSVHVRGPLAGCRLCPRQCGVDRPGGELGACRAGAKAEVFRYGPHHGEEPPVSGTHGSGAVFFSRCTLRCLYCQNYPWSQEGQGQIYTVPELADVFHSLRGEGCHNLNLVSPTPWVTQIDEALQEFRSGGSPLPVVYNTSGFERPETLIEVAELVDVFLTDLRYVRPETAEEGSGRADYVSVTRRALLQMQQQAGTLALDANGLVESGVICRVLVLPGRADEAVESLRWIAESLGTDTAVSIMAQYTPAHRAASAGPWGRRITSAEYETVCRAAEQIGLTNGWLQDFKADAPAELVGYRMEPGRSANKDRDKAR